MTGFELLASPEGWSLLGGSPLLGAAASAPAGPGSFMLMLGFGLALAALVCFVLELFVPTGGLLGLACAICVIGSTAAFFMHDPMLGVAAAAVYCVLAPMMLVFGLRIWSHSPIARRFILGAAEDADPDDEEAMVRSEVARQHRHEELRALVGAEGRAVTPLRPVGFVSIAGRRIDALAEGNVIDAGTKVVVVDIVDNQLKVRPASEVAAAPGSDAVPESGAQPSSP